MRQTIQIRGGDAFSKKLVSFSTELNRSTQSLLGQEARALAVELGSATLPLGLGVLDAAKMAGRVDKEVRRTFASRQDPGTVFRMLKAQKGIAIANAYWHAYKAKKTRKMGQILTAAGLPESGATAAQLHTARTNRNASVPTSQLPLSLVRESEVRALSRRQQLLVGTAKAGWYQSAKSLGGRVRKNTRDFVGENRRTEEIFPEYIRKISNRFSGLGGSRFVANGAQSSVTIFSSVRHANEALEETLFRGAMTRAEERFNRGLLEALRYVRQKTFKTAA